MKSVEDRERLLGKSGFEDTKSGRKIHLTAVLHT